MVPIEAPDFSLRVAAIETPAKDAQGGRGSAEHAQVGLGARRDPCRLAGPRGVVGCGVFGFAAVFDGDPDAEAAEGACAVKGMGVST